MRHAFKPDATEKAHAAQKKRAGGGDAPRGYWCAACETRIADDDAAIVVAGAHRHRFVNPAGVAFEIGCFGHARCRIEGAPTLVDTWFAGFAWSYALCANCGAHHGGAYEGDRARVVGHIVARLVGPI